MNAIFAIAGVVVKEMYRRKDFYVLFVMTALITLIMGSVSFFDDKQIVRYVKELCLVLIWISSIVIAVTTAARQIPAEKESRTIFPLLAKPVSRAQLILGKYVGCLLACGITLVIFYGFFIIISGSREHVWLMNLYAQAFCMHWAALSIIIAMVLLGSLVFTAQSSNVTISLCILFGIIFLGKHLNVVASRSAGISSDLLLGIYYTIPHLDWNWDIQDLLIHNNGVIHWADVAGAVAYASAYTAVFLGAAWMIFRKRSLA